MDDGAVGEPEVESRPHTAPDSLQVSLIEFADETQAREFGHLVYGYVREISRYIDLSTLDGVTISFTYAKSLLDLDRGYETSFQLVPTTDGASGVAMTPAVIRDRQLKSHIVLDGNMFGHLLDPKGEFFRPIFHALAHECTHVEITAAYDRCFPGEILRQQYSTMLDQLRWQVILACWDEYAATHLSAGFGEDPTEGYAETFLNYLDSMQDRIERLATKYFEDHDINRAVTEAFGAYGNLLKFASYLIGSMDGYQKDIGDLPELKEKLSSHWFEPYFMEFRELCRTLMKNMGQWEDKKDFKAIGEFVEELIFYGGIVIIDAEDGTFQARIPFVTPSLQDGY